MKKSNLTILIIVICAILLLIFTPFNTNKQTNQEQHSINDPAYTPGCNYIYKTNQNYFEYIAGIANNETGEYKLMSWPTNFQDKKLVQGYISGRGGCMWEEESLADEWVILNAIKSEIYNTHGFPGCLELKKQTYPECYNQTYKEGQNQECDTIFEKESNSETSICPTHSISTSSIMAKNVLTEFYVCNNTNIEQSNSIIENNQLDTSCIKII